MFKLIVMLKRRPELTHEQFRDYMENHHAPFALKLLEDALPLSCRKYVRNYISRPDVKPLIKLDDSYDVMTEFWFNDKATYEAFVSWHNDPESGAAIRADEARFIDGAASRFVFVDEVEQLETLSPVAIALPTTGK